MKVINATTIGNLIKAHMERDERKFLSYANFIQQSYEEEGDVLNAKIIRKSIDGSYKNEPQVSLDIAESRCIPDVVLTDSDIELVKKHNDYTPWLDFKFNPLYIEVIQQFVSLLDGSEYNTKQIMDEEFIKDVMWKNREKNGLEKLYFQINPVSVIRDGIDHICKMLPVYKETEKKWKSKEWMLKHAVKYELPQEMKEQLDLISKK